MLFAINLLFAILWVALTGEANSYNFMLGFILGYLALHLTNPQARYVRLTSLVIAFSGYFFWSIIVSNYQMGWTVLFPNGRLKPAIVAIPLDLNHRGGITLLANWITLTPGTLSLDISADQKILYVHTIHVGSDVDAFRQQINQYFERRVIELFGG